MERRLVTTDTPKIDSINTLGERLFAGGHFRPISRGRQLPGRPDQILPQAPYRFSGCTVYKQNRIACQGYSRGLAIYYAQCAWTGVMRTFVIRGNEPQMKSRTTVKMLR